jgi:trehalose-phosphatase
VSKAALKTPHHSWFFKQVGVAKNRVLLLDYDGTLAPFHANRDRALPYPEIPELLHNIMGSCGTRLIIVSGRPAREVPRLLGMYPQPEIWGTYGIEKIHADGRYEEAPVSHKALLMLAKAEARLERKGLGDLIEVKLAAVALHWRGLPASDVPNIRAKANGVLQPLALQPDLALAEFDEGMEIRLSSANKGNTLRNFLLKLDSGVPVAYLGDDAEDEDAFRALNGKGLTVLVGPKPRLTAAQTWLKPPAELRQFLMNWIEVCRGAPVTP